MKIYKLLLMIAIYSIISVSCEETTDEIKLVEQFENLKKNTAKEKEPMQQITHHGIDEFFIKKKCVFEKKSMKISYYSSLLEYAVSQCVDRDFNLQEFVSCKHKQQEQFLSIEKELSNGFFFAIFSSKPSLGSKTILETPMYVFFTENMGKVIYSTIREDVCQESPVDFQIKTSTQSPAQLMTAVLNGNVAEIQKLIDKNVDINAKYPLAQFKCDTPFSCATLLCYSEIVLLLHNAGAKDSKNSANLMTHCPK